MHRFFVSPQVLQASPVILTGGQAHQVRHVLRLRPGDRVVFLDNRGSAYDAVLRSYEGDAALFSVAPARRASGDPAVHVTLFQAVLKGERFEWVLQKGTELGIGRFVPLVCDRSVVGDQIAIAGKRERWERIIREAAEQCGRARLPELAAGLAFPGAVGSCVEAGGPPLRLILWEGERALGLRQVLAGCNLGPGSRIQVFVGPEGGFTEDEVAWARGQGVCPVSLGPRILRAETAVVAAAAAIFYESGDMAPVRTGEVGETE